MDIAVHAAWLLINFVDGEMIDIENEKLILPRDVCLMFPGRNGRGLSRSTIWRWMFRGKRGARLESIVVCGQRYTSREAVQRFIVACDSPAVSPPLKPCVRVSRTSIPNNLALVEGELQYEGF